ncbi:MAG TPA: acyl-ACP--UDP-N-acetylglucosamine O-acyltransferase [Cyclobacteriaceae bacterium]|nr:acyl-ACP--UDP-N-acetylglucosamine O-acyltransferase [Cyclobacteriaceae bacterium]
MISKLSEIHANAKLGKNVTVEAFTSIHDDVEIGDGTWIGSNVTIYPGARIGKNCKVFPGAVISAVPQDLKFQGEESTVEIGDNTTIRECVTINRGTVDKQTTKVGESCLLMAYVHIAHDCIIGNHVIIANSVQVAGHVSIDEWAIIGGSSAIHQFVRIGMHSLVSGGSLVRKDVPPYTKAAREPLSYAGVNSLGLRRRGFTSDTINHIQEVYRYLFLNSLNNSRALEEIEINLPATKERDEIVNFIRSSERGLMKGYIN